MPQPKLTYFNFDGRRGEAIRLAPVVAGHCARISALPEVVAYYEQRGKMG